jgi:hypothetical protein
MSDSNNFHFAAIPSSPTDGKNKQSRLGGISITIGVVSIVLFILSYLLTYVANNYNHLHFYWRTAYFFAENEDTLNAIGNLLLCFIPLLPLAGMIVGIISIRNKQERKVVGVIGLVINIALLLLLICIFTLLLLIGRTPF